MAPLERLLDLQDLDTALDRLGHRRRTLPERARLAELAAAQAELATAAAEPRAERAELARAQSRLEDEIAGVEEKAAAVDRQLYGGSITSPKEAQAFQADLESLKRRQGVLEDEVLELMEAAEPLDARLAEADAALAVLDAEAAEVTTALTASEAVVDAEIAELTGRRSALAAELDPSLVAMYDDLRPQFDGVAIARLQGATCQGCHLTLAAFVVDQLRHEPPDAVVHCPECARILVR
jgi:predicted  nucleic acid-binding Zn-ribbon protein